MYTFTTIILLSSTCSLTTAAWFQTYQEEKPEDGDARVGFIQLNSGSTSFNTTLNLTGPILLGLGIAAATLFYAYFNAFSGRKKRSVDEGLISLEPDTDLLTVLDAVELSTSLEDFLDSAGVTTRQCKMKAVCEIYQNQDQAGKVDSIEEMVRMVVEMLSRKPESEEASSVGFSWVEAAEAGLGDKRCDQIFTECQDLDFKQNLLQLSF